MGMFDTLTIDLELLPISEDDKKKYLSDLLDGFQTKSLDSLLDRYEITSGGYLFKTNYDGEIYQRQEKVYFTGEIEFYTDSEDGTWFEFKAQFIDGKLESIKRFSSPL